MRRYKPFGILVDGQGGGGAQSAPIAEIAGIGKPKTLPLINTDDTDQNTAMAKPTAGGGGATRVDQNLERIRLYVVGRSSGRTRVSPTELMKFTSPNQRGRTCMWMWPATPAPAALPMFIPRLMPSGR